MDNNNCSPPPIKRLKMENVASNSVQADEETYLINGISVNFPVKPYSSQYSVMNAVIKGCNKKINSLIESPTGSGKTMALLCSSLAWQSHHYSTLVEEKHKHNTNPSNSLNDNSDQNISYQKVPRIFYGTRTHKQIDQVIREFKKTEYKNKRMTILSSREHTCIYDKLAINKSKTELCSELLDPENNKAKCPYFENISTIYGIEALQKFDQQRPWDIEDLLKFGRKHTVCPYFSARKFLDEAEIIFCPYNYIMDPSVRATMKLNLTGEIVIIDEAHNIEDVCRNIACNEIRIDQLDEAIEEFQFVGGITSSGNINLFGVDIQRMDNYQIVVDCLTSIRNFTETQSLKLNKEGGKETKCLSWPGEELWELFSNTVFNFVEFNQFRESCLLVIGEYLASKENPSIKNIDNESPVKRTKDKKDVITPKTKGFLEKLLGSLLWIQSTKHASDFECCIFESFHQRFMEKDELGRWKLNAKGKHLRSLKFICMSSAVIFEEISKEARTVILASGTLSPLSTLKSELGVKFDCEVQAKHVINKDQIYVREISNSLSGYPMNVVYSQANLLSFQNELADLIIQVCQIVPHGVLCFFSSYSMLKKQLGSWFITGKYKEISKLKFIFEEPQNSKDIDNLMTDYRLKIKETSSQPMSDKNGAILFAVFRGKVAEGIDFVDNEARCVITVGIPYAAKNDLAVNFKMKYNDKYEKSKGLLKGREWYAVQAFRSLNQALGRCIRHKNDWGIILLVDDRIPQNRKNLPKWIMSMQQTNLSYNLINELKIFVTRNLKCN